MALLTNLLGEFYRCNLPFFPVIEGETADKSGPANKLAGFLSRKDLDRAAADLGRLHYECKEIPKQLLIQKISPIELLKKASTIETSIPVLDRRGKLVMHWSETQLLQALGQMAQSPSNKTPSQTSPLSALETKRKDTGVGHSRWLGELLLQAFPWPLYACDLQGKTLFFNALFESKILSKAKAKNSIRHVENYLLETVRNLLAQSFSENPLRRHPHSVLSMHDKSLDHYVYIVNLEEQKHVHGYFFIFQAGEDPGFFTEVDRRLKGKAGLADIIQDLEKRIIYNSLEKNGKNTSHTAQALQVKRSTLQNKIQRLGIDKHLERIMEGPIRRKPRSAAKANALRKKPKGLTKKGSMQKSRKKLKKRHVIGR